ncbi:dihydropteroate synthase [Tenuibacillus multivorans]|uniref:Dihydropteroate synthase n=2 Tax=Tenuibacillus multivorans TaxID=237069 RepID=A0A1G9VXA7_9BACI|nr:dihydropteroate synthase [Tenuibacillus multivorans]SDM76928.1 dihydropteroate synthase [Tenuibacillus multivorans]
MHHMIVNEQYRLNFDQETIVMGILNVTPDSFSDGGKFNTKSKAIEHAKFMVENGAKIIDIGGESTRPGHKPVSADEEIERVVPMIEQVTTHLDVPVSIDTFKAKTADHAVQAGATIINDVWGAKADPEIADVSKTYNTPIILMHNQDEPHYDDLIEDMKKSLAESIDIAIKRGVSKNKIILDPGVGFGKTQQHNLLAMRRLHELQTLGYPMLLGTSRKSVVGKALDLPVEERLEGTIATVCSGIQQGVEIVRVHDVKKVSRAVKMMDAILGKGDHLHG